MAKVARFKSPVGLGSLLMHKSRQPRTLMQYVKLIAGTVIGAAIAATLIRTAYLVWFVL